MVDRVQVGFHRVAGDVEGLAPGIYRYRPDRHDLLKIADGDKRSELARAALGQSYVRNAPVDLVVSGIYKRITSRYGQRGVQYTQNEVGHVGQNIHLQCISLNLGTVVIGAFNDNEVRRVMGMSGDETPIYIMPIGKT